LRSRFKTVGYGLGLAIASRRRAGRRLLSVAARWPEVQIRAPL